MPKPTHEQILVASVVMLQAFRLEHAKRGIESPVRQFRDYPLDQQRVIQRVVQRMLIAATPENMPRMMERIASADDNQR